jgi:hypothetical protein
MSQEPEDASEELKFFYAQLELLANLSLGRNDHSIPVIRDKYVTWEACFQSLQVQDSARCSFLIAGV